MPAVAPEIAANLGLVNAGAFDLNAVCAGFTYGLHQAAAAVATGADAVLLVSAEHLTPWLDTSDKNTYPIFADGAGSVVVRAHELGSVGPAIYGHDGFRSELIRTDDESRIIRMSGSAVYKWATRQIPILVEEICAKSHVQIDDIGWLVLHQANDRILSSVANTLGIADEKVVRTISWLGNTSSASIPISLEHLNHSDRYSEHDNVLLLGFGSGLSYCGQIVRLPKR
jgi:3-oxoacyl-[acyl-carrier-protein] synthase III